MKHATMIVAIVLVLSLGGAVFATGDAENGSSSEEPVTLQVIYPGNQSNRMAEFVPGAFNERLREELNIEVEVSYFPWDQYWNKKDLMIAAGEQIDWYWHGAGGFSQVIAKRAAVPLNDLLQQYGQDLLQVIPEDNFGPFTLDGQIMAIPSQTAPTSEKFLSILVRKDLMDEVGVSSIESIADLEDLYRKVLELHPEMGFAAEISPALLREYSGFGFSRAGVENSLMINEETGEVEVMFFTDAWQDVAKKVGEWNDLGWISEDLTIRPNEGMNRLVTGRYLFATGAISRPLEQINRLRNNVPDAELVEFLLAPEKPRYRLLASTEIVCVSPTAEHPEQAMQMLNWMFENQEHYLFSIYGIEGVDYTIENERLNLINTDRLWYEWMFRNANYLVFPDSVSEDFIQSYQSWDEGAQLSAAFGFSFDPSEVKNEEARINQVFLELVEPIMNGFVDFEEHYPQMVEDLENAGIERYRAEYQRQLDAYLDG